MRKSKIYLGLFAAIISFQINAVPAAIPDQQPGPKVKLKPNAANIIKARAPDPSFRIHGVIREMRCEDHEVMVRSDSGTEYRVFPTAFIAGHRVRNNSDIVSLCRRYLRFNQAVNVRGNRSEIGGRQVISNAAVSE